MTTMNKLLRASTLVLTAVLALSPALASASPVSMPASQTEADPPASIPEPDAIRLAEAFRLVEELGDEIWPGFREVPFPVLLVTAEREYLVGWEAVAPEGFEDLGVDERLDRGVLTRARMFSPGMEASFPAFGLPAVVVFGTAEATGRVSTEWVLTLLHEHLHQLQYAAPGYYAEAEALDLAKADPSGMWMLNYPFPYEDQTTGERFGAVAASLRTALQSDSDGAEAWALLRELLEQLEPADARYLSFQLWQEGIGRYVELRAAEVAAVSFTPSERFAGLEDALDWSAAARAEHERTVRALEDVSLADNGRVSFYAVGAALGVLLDRAAPDWRDRYLTHKFALHEIAKAARGE